MSSALPEQRPAPSADATAALPAVTAAPPIPAGDTRQSAPAGYEIERELGRGGMGVVYQARHLALNRTVALKMILGGGHAGTADLERFKTEAEAIARLQHPNIVQIHDVGAQDGLPYFSMEFCPGGSLDRKLDGTPLPPREAAQLVQTVALAVQAAHDKRVIHRDLKPANVLLGHDGTPRVTDFGLAKQLDEAGRTGTGAVLGTPSYMAPEQAEGRKDIGTACDVYALGAILYECLTGRPPFKAATVLDTLLQVIETEPVPPRQLQPSTPRDLETICLKCLHKQAARRYGSATALAEDLQRYLDGEAIVARPAGRTERLGKWVRRKPALAGLLGVAAAALVGFVALGLGFTLSLNDARHKAEELAQQEAAQRADADTQKKRAVQKAAELEKSQQETRAAARKMSNALTQAADSAWNAGDVPRAWQFHRAIGPEHRGWEWGYLRRRLQGSYMTLYGHTNCVSSVAFSPDGRRILTGSWDGTAKVWDAQTGTEVLTLKGHAGGVWGVAWSPDGRRVLTGSGEMFGGDEAKVWDARTGAEVLALKGASSPVAYSPDGRHLLTGSKDGRKVWDAQTGQELRTLKGHTGNVNSVAFSPDGTRLVTGSTDKTAKIWDVQTGAEILTLKGHAGFVNSVAYSSDGRRLATGCSDTTVQVWDAQTGAALLSLKGHAGTANSVTFNPDGRHILAAGPDWTAKVWDADTGQELLTLKGHTSNVTGLAFSPATCTNLGDPRPGLAACDGLLRRDPHSATAYSERAKLHAAFLQFDDATADQLMGLALSSTNPKPNER